MEPPGSRGYEDLRIALTLAERSGESISGSLVATVRGQTPDIIQSFRLRVSRSDIDEAFSTVSFASRQISSRRAQTAHKGVLDPIKYLGANLFAALFDGPLGSLYQEKVRSFGSDAPPLRLRIAMNDPVLDELPWEFLYDSVRSDFPALSMRTPIVRELFGNQMPRLSLGPITPPLRVLVADARVTEGINSEREISMLKNVMSESDIHLEILTEATRESLVDAIQEKRPHILHFIGTGGSRGTGDGFSSPPQELVLHGRPGALLNTWETIGPVALGTELSNVQELHLVFLNACHTNFFATRLAEFVPAVVGMRELVSDAMCQAFAEGFYRAASDGHPLDGAVTAGRQNIDRTNPGGREWGLPVLYMSVPDGPLLGTKVAQPTATSSSKFEPATPISSKDPASQREWLRLHRLLNFYKSNIAALEASTKPYASSPEFIERQFASQLSTLRDKAAGLEAELRKLDG
ncbi:MAG: CHAT domain-containing protein [Planctomycetes bacterium]|nr:CHAT domain-containing protein [Planctomycetota bacterium]MBI3843238.1 CHAT domain-containing protein [Planctomycetota bacterium]